MATCRNNLQTVIDAEQRCVNIATDTGRTNEDRTPRRNCNCYQAQQRSPIDHQPLKRHIHWLISLSLSLSLSIFSILSAIFQVDLVIRYQNVSILDFIGAKDDGGGGNYSGYSAKLHSNRHHQHINTQLFRSYMTFLCPANSVRALNREVKKQL